MGRELAAAIGRWAALEDHPVTPRLEAICDTSSGVAPLVRAHRHPPRSRPTTTATCWTTPTSTSSTSRSRTTCTSSSTSTRSPPARTSSARSRSASTSPPAADRRRDRGRDVFVALLQRGALLPGRPVRVRHDPQRRAGRADRGRNAFLHSSDLDRAKPINWKRQAEFCGTAGVINDLGMHVAAPPAAARLAPAAALRRAPGHRARAPRPRRRAVPATRGTTRRSTPTPASRSRSPPSGSRRAR